jgi:hypothetical protein
MIWIKWDKTGSYNGNVLDVYLVRISVQTAPILNGACRCSPQYLHKIAGKMPRLGNDCFLQNPWQFAVT